MRRFRRGAGGGAPADWLIVGLGNPGAEHAGSRHNVGFMVAERLCERWQLSRAKDAFRGRLAEGRVRGAAFLPGDVDPPTPVADRPDLGPTGVSVAVLCPLTYMNDAGRSVAPARGALKVELERVLVVHDEIDLRFGDVRTRLGGGLAGHNGLKSLKRELGGSEFMRVRVGVGRPSSSDPEVVSAYVLGRFREAAEEVRQLIDRACEAVERVVLGME
ncbi:MAG TPA: aminoacyl-tRNA hydrolase [Solirubrobacteraceae bacterium]|nr:aminoacyl-tRNA hydrolase [Solirubrobacteraceae bacterium]